ncbi:nuclear transport factor 2 family protein [Sphingomonas sp.]|uniref:nuclear transport factor 2 family protein n=1 Tax=Sphingomonas sp. TaxID=28214 RepID=UPI001D4BD412|nr:nuclear transport factor 2 family protein [Sphingomonas sp.]MBX9795847.1 nuclear transport factor 2 family protein [Sphingomonas sp.]
MTQAAIRAVLDQYVAAWQAGDVGAVIACYHDDFTLHYAGSNALSGTHVGKAAALGVLAEFSRRVPRQLVGIVSVMAGETRGAVIARERLGQGAAAIEVERVLVYAVADDRLAECWVYDGDQPAIDRLIGTA